MNPLILPTQPSISLLLLLFISLELFHQRLVDSVAKVLDSRGALARQEGQRDEQEQSWYHLGGENDRLIVVGDLEITVCQHREGEQA